MHYIYRMMYNQGKMYRLKQTAEVFCTDTLSSFQPNAISIILNILSGVAQIKKNWLIFELKPSLYIV